MVTIGHCSAYGNKIHHQLICGCCGKYLGSYNIENEKGITTSKDGCLSLLWQRVRSRLCRLISSFI